MSTSRMSVRVIAVLLLPDRAAIVVIAAVAGYICARATVEGIRWVWLCTWVEAPEF
jgi:hypothetical protein